MESKKETMTILVVEPGKYPYRKEIPSTLEEMQKVVGGLIEIIYPWQNSPAALICNDEGKSFMPFNRYLPSIKDIICGTFFICDGSGDDLQTLGEKIWPGVNRSCIRRSSFGRKTVGCSFTAAARKNMIP